MLLAACSATGSVAGEGTDETCDGTTRSLFIAPSVIPRGAELDVQVSWEHEEDLAAPARVRLFAGEDDAVEVELALEMTREDAREWSAVILNPFGRGAPAGPGWVLAQAEADDPCSGDRIATAVFELE